MEGRPLSCKVEIAARAGAAAVLFAILSAAGPALAHEFWLEPLRFAVPEGSKVQAQIRVGQDFKGSAYSYISRDIEQFTFTLGGESRPVKGRDGDTPALSVQTEGEGLGIVSYQNTFSTLRFTEWERFTYYVEYEGLEGVIERHRERGLPQTGFKEKYKRCAKALVGIGNAQGEDRLTGMQFEWVAEDNPYTATGDSLRVRLYLEGKPYPDHDFNVFQYNGEQSLTRYRTDAEGRATISLKGGGKFLLNAVHLFEGDNVINEGDPEYFSYWASLVFGTAGTDELLAKAAQKVPAKSN